MDLETAKDYIEDLIAERSELFERIRQLETRLNEVKKSAAYWQKKAVSND